MGLHVLFLFILLINLGCVVSELSLRFVIITEIHEHELPQQIGRAMKVVEENTPGATITDDVLQLDRQNDEESYRQLCSAISKGVSLIIDLSWFPWEAAEELSSSAGIPLVRGLLGSQQLVGAFNSYLESRNATDAAILLENESDVDQNLYELLGRSHIRVWVHAGFTKDTANALKSMRPEPSFYVIVGDSAFVTNTYRRDDVNKDTNDAPAIQPNLLKHLQVRVWLHAGFTKDTANALKSMRPEPSFFIIVGNSAFVTNTYRRAVKEKLVKRSHRWNLILTDYDNFDLTTLVLPTVILQPDPVECCKLLNLKEECSCALNGQKKQYILNNLIQYSVDVLTKIEADVVKIDCENPAGEMNVTKDRFYQVLEEDSTNNETLLFWDDERSTLFLRSRFILSTYKVDEGLQRIAYWNANEQYKLLPGVVLEPLRNFFRIGTSAATPWTMVKYDPDTGEPMMTEDGQPIYEGYCIDLIDKIAETMGFDYEIVTPKSGTFGRRLPNGSWDGIVGDLTTGETDIVVAALTMTAEREEVIDFVAPYFEQTGILIVIRKPIRKTSLFKFMTVLRTEVWLSIVAALLLTGFMIWLLEKYSPYSAKNNPDAYPYACREFTLKESFWFALTSFTPQGGGEAPKALSGRTLVAAYWLFVVLMLATFTANLAAFLTVERMQAPVASLEQLARQSRINYTVVEGSTIHQYFINMKFAEDTLYRVWKEITLNATSDQSQYRVWDYPIREQYGHILLAINTSGPVPDAATGFQQVNEHSEADFAFIHDSAEIKYEITRNCNLTEVGEVFAEQPYAIAVQQGSRLQEDLSRTLLDLQKERFLEQLSSKYWNETARQACPDADESEGITLESLGGVFIATLFGLGLAMITLAWEVFYYKRKEKNRIRGIDAAIEKTEAFVEKKKDKLPSKVAEGVAKLRKRKKNSGNIVKNVTIGDHFKPADTGISYISVYPKDGYRP